MTEEELYIYIIHPLSSAILGSNPIGDMDVSLLFELCVVR
jgi:hypothetical protein